MIPSLPLGAHTLGIIIWAHLVLHQVKCLLSQPGCGPGSWAHIDFKEVHIERLLETHSAHDRHILHFSLLFPLGPGCLNNFPLSGFLVTLLAL